MKTFWEYKPESTLKVASSAVSALATMVKNEANLAANDWSQFTVEVDLEMANVVLKWSPSSRVRSRPTRVDVQLDENNRNWVIDEAYSTTVPAEAGKKAAELLLTK